MKYYAETHEWIEVVDGIATMGISTFAAEELGDLTYVEMPAVGKAFAAGAVIGTVESVKAASDIFAPIGGTVSEVNDALAADPALLNQAPESDGWICRLKDVKEDELKTLLTAEQYQKTIAE